MMVTEKCGIYYRGKELNCVEIVLIVVGVAGFLLMIYLFYVLFNGEDL